MKIIKILTDDEIRQEIPRGVLDALQATDPSQLMYCNRCDGIRLLEHDCHCWNCGSPTCHILECLRNTPTPGGEKNMPKTSDIPLIPVTGDHGVSEGLVLLTQVLHEQGYAEASGGGLGGTYGYGCQFENGIFLITPYCWCDETECPQCGHDAPNFLHKPSGSMVHWYKYIGRGQITNLTIPWSTIMMECIRSLGLPPGKEAA